MSTTRIIVGDNLQTLRTLADESVHCCVTSPPYFGLRDYDLPPTDWPEVRFTPLEGLPPVTIPAMRCCLGLEASPWEFIGHMVLVFRELHRVLRADGTLWLNIGDSYAGSGRGGYPGGKSGLQGTTTGQDNTRAARAVSEAQRKNCPTVQGARIPAGFHARRVEEGALGRAWSPPPRGLKKKDLIGVPWMLAFALRAEGWILRQEIIWAKPNPMPESITDRCTKSHESLFLLAKSKRYYFDQAAILEPASQGTHARLAQDIANQKGSNRVPTREHRPMKASARNGVGWGYDKGEERARKADPAPGNKNNPSFDAAMAVMPPDRNKRSVWTITTQPFKGAHFATFPQALVEPCVLAGCPVDGVVLDLYGGAGTTGLVANRLQRHAILLELNPKYAEIARLRLVDDAKIFAQVTVETPHADQPRETSAVPDQLGHGDSAAHPGA